MTTNAYLFVWDTLGLESIVPISQYNDIEAENLILLLKDEPILRNPLNGIVQSILLRAQLNPHRQYEVYTIETDYEIDENEWHTYWKYDQHSMENLIRNKGNEVFSDRVSTSPQ